jgi:hypothetical protein
MFDKNDLMNGDWLQKVMDKKSMIFIMVKNVHFFGHDILYYYVKVWIIILHDHIIFLKNSSLKEKKRKKIGYMVMGKDQHIGYVVMFDYGKRPSHCNAHT